MASHPALLAVGIVTALVALPFGVDQVGQAVADAMGDRKASDDLSARSVSLSPAPTLGPLGVDPTRPFEEEPGYQDYVEGVGQDPVIIIHDSFLTPVAPRPAAVPDDGPDLPPPPTTPKPPPPKDDEIVDKIVEPPLVDIACNGKDPGKALPNYGAIDGSAAFTDLAWGVFKTGFRFAAAWTSDAEYTGSLIYSLDNGPIVIVDETTFGKQHLIVMDLPSGAIGSTIRFRVGVDWDGDGSFEGADLSDIHEGILCNAWNAFSLHRNAYVENLMVRNAADDSTSRPALEQGMNLFAIKTSDATDGWVRIGLVLVVYNDPEVQISNGEECTGTRCDSYDVKFVQAPDSSFPGPTIPAANAILNGIGTPGGRIEMFQTTGQAPPNADAASGAWEVGSVLTHENGHYAFGMSDKYTSPVPTDCYNGLYQVSVMGGSREASEFDDEYTRCPNEQDIEQLSGGYSPSWEEMMQNYVAIPSRAVEQRLPETGPVEAGPYYLLFTMDMLGSIVPAPPDPEA